MLCCIYIMQTCKNTRHMIIALVGRFMPLYKDYTKVVNLLRPEDYSPPSGYFLVMGRHRGSGRLDGEVPLGVSLARRGG